MFRFIRYMPTVAFLLIPRPWSFGSVTYTNESHKLLHVKYAREKHGKNLCNFAHVQCILLYKRGCILPRYCCRWRCCGNCENLCRIQRYLTLKCNMIQSIPKAKIRWLIYTRQLNSKYDKMWNISYTVILKPNLIFCITFSKSTYL